MAPATTPRKNFSEVDGEQQHEYCNDDINGDAVVCPHTGVPVGEAPGARGGEGVNEGVVQGHTGNFQAEDLQGGEGEVHGVQNFGGL